MEFRVLGALEVTRGGEPLVVASGKQRALLALLILNANRTLSPDRLIDELWGEEPPQSGTKAVVFHVSKLRQILEPDRAKGDPGSVLLTEPGGYVLRTDPGSIDAQRFERLAAEGRSLLPAEAEMAAVRLREALSLWRGDPLAEFVYEPFAEADIRRLEELHHRALEDRLEADLALGHHEVVIGELEGLVAEHPMRERIRGQLMLALYRCGRQAAALRVYQEGRRLLVEELGIDPSPELRRLEELVLRQDPQLDLDPAAAPVPATLRNPYKGLRPFGEADAVDFFGREALVGRLVDRLWEVREAGRLLTLVGPSGSGKSSVVRAGVIPAIRAGALPGSERWLVTVMYPGSRPWEELEAALLRVATHPSASLLDQLEEDRHGLARAVMRILPSDDSQLLLVVDQFEELFSLVQADDTRARFLEALLTASAAEHSRLLVIATLRADFLDVSLRDPDFGEHIRTGLEVITPLTTSELELAITKPAERAGAAFEGGVAARILSDVADQPGTLPLLQYALTELFDRSDSRCLSLDTYTAIGGVLDAVGRRAEEVYLGLSPVAQETSRQLFLRLVIPRDGAEAIAGRVLLSELESVLGQDTPLPAVLDEFGRRRLLTFDRDTSGERTVEVAHEALLSRWARLAAWIDEQREDLWVRSRLHDAADEWVAAGRDTGFLLSAGRLDLFDSWYASTDLRLSLTDQQFLQDSLAERRRQEEDDAARAAHEKHLERRAATRLRVLVGVFAGAALVAVVLSLVVLGQQRAARQQEAIASARELAAASIGALGSDPELSMLLALEAARTTADRGYIVEEAMDALHWAMQESQTPYPPTDAPVALRRAPDGQRGVFLLAPDQLVQHAAAGAGRKLSAKECRTYLHQASCPDSFDWSGELEVYTADGPALVQELADDSLAGSRIKVIADFGLEPGSLITGFRGETGVVVTWPSGGVGGDLEAQLAAADRPDVAVISRPGLIPPLVDQGHLVDMGAVLDPGQVVADVDPYLGELGIAADGGRYGVPWAVSVSSLIWYPVAEFEQAGYRIPETWEDLLALSRQMVADGRTPWCLGVEAGVDSGAVATDWVEDLVLGTSGPSVYDEWVETSTGFQRLPGVRSSFRRLGEIALGEGLVLGSGVNIPRDLAAWPMFSEPPRCWLYRDGAESRADWPPTALGELGAFPFPEVDSNFGDSVTGRVYMIVMLRDRPEVRRFVEYLLSSEAAAMLAGGAPVQGLLPARSTDPEVLQSETSRAQDALLRGALEAGLFRVGASDLMPAEVGSGSFPDGLLTYLTWGETVLDQVLADIGEAWP